MPLGTSLVLSKDPATPPVTNQITFALRGSSLGSSEYSVAGLNPPVANVLKVSHDTGKGGEGRHMIREDLTAVDVNLMPATGSVYAVIVNPSSTAITNQMIIDCVNRLVDFLTAGGNANVVKILNGEV